MTIDISRPTGKIRVRISSGRTFQRDITSKEVAQLSQALR